MSSFINDGALIGFWPLNEPSGAPFFANHSPARAQYPSGISFDLHVAVATTATAIDHTRAKSLWPGTASVFNPESGVTYRGYMAQGYWKIGSDSSPFSRYLVLGNGASQVREQTLSQNVINSGITVGAWIYPNSNGYATPTAAVTGDLNVTTYNWETEMARAHSLIGQFLWNNAAGGYHMGVSGRMDGGAQFNSTQFGGPAQLAAYVALESNNTTNPLSLRTPIESGRPTHIAFTYRFVDGTSNQVVLYKDGRVAASGTTSVELDLSNASILSRAFGIGNADDASAGTNNYAGTAGWKHLVSGVYLFRRTLNEGEMLVLHNEGGFEPQPNNILSTQIVQLTDDKLLGYYPFKSIGFADVSKNHYPLVASIDEGDADNNIVCPGPFNGGGVMQNAGTANATALVAVSGLVDAFLAARSWTIGIYAGPAAQGNGRDDNMIFSFGSVSTNVGNTAPTAISAATFGMALTEFGTPNRMRFSAYPLGDITASVFDIDTATSGYHSTSVSHYGVVYDDQTRGIALYLNGALQGSGTLAHSLTDQLVRLAGSGYPLMFGNGVQDTITDAAGRGLFSNGANKMCLGPITILGRPILPAEMRYIAQNGIDISATYRTLYDSRLMGYWPCDQFSIDDVIVPDKARIWNINPGHLVRGDTSYKWNLAYTSPFQYDLFKDRILPAELASYGNLGITSGIFSVQGTSPGVNVVTDANGARSAIGNLSSRYKPCNEENDLICQNILGEYIIGYEVTPSGRIPLTLLGSTSDTEKFEFNSTLLLYGGIGANTSPGSIGEIRSFLTTIDAAQGSGVTIIFQGREGTFAGSAFKPLVSGVLPFGVPSKVLFHTKFNAPYNVTNQITGQAEVLSTLWINGIKIQSVTLPASTSKIWTSQPPNSSAETWTISVGGEIGNTTLGTQNTRDGGLGDIYMRELFVMRGIFEEDEVHALAVSGIQQPTIPGYTPSVPTTQVNVIDADLQGYWRFNGTVNSMSGVLDLSNKGHDLSGIIQGRILAGAANNTARLLQFLPGPLAQSDLLVRCSGISFTDQTAGVNTPFYPPFAVSGEAFNRPNVGFSVGFLLAKKNDVVTASTADTILAYGTLGATVVNSTTVDLNRGWAIINDDNNDIKMVLSTAGNGYYDNAGDSAQSGQLVCGTFEADSLYEDLTRFDNYRWGHPRPSRLDSLAHYCWVFDPVRAELICYVNGNEVDRKALKIGIDSHTGSTSGLGPNVPINHAAKMITFLNHQATTPWDFTSNTLNDQSSILTDVFYFSRALTEQEVKYIAMNGIDDAQGTEVSGIIGGFIHGQDTASGIIGGYNRGQDSASGIIGGFDFAAFASSGIIGGYVSGIVFFDSPMSGIVGGYILGSDAGSGMIGGFIRASDACSGIFGGFVLGGLRNSMQFDGSFVVQAFAAKDFDSQLTIRKKTSADFDAKIIIFQAETGPLVDIIVPGSTVSGVTTPFNQYFIGAASGTQGKTIVQTRWTFGDLTPPVSVAESGAGLYPVQHYFAGSGFYIAKFEVIDSDGIHGSATRIINAASGIDPVIVSLSGVPRSGAAILTVDFTTTVDILPPGVLINASLLNFDDGQSTITFNPTHEYTEPGVYKPVWVVRDSRGVIWCDSLQAGNDYLGAI